VTDYELMGKAPLASFCFGFRPRFCGPSARFKMCSRPAKNTGEPHGRAVLVWRRRNSICAASSVPSQARQSATTPRGGKSAAKSGSLRRPQWAAALDLRIRFRTRHHPGANRIAFDITDCRLKKALSIQRRGAEMVLPQMPTLPPPVVYPQSKTGMRTSKTPSQRLFLLLQNRNKMHVIIHQAVRPDTHSVLLRVLTQQGQVMLTGTVVIEHTRSPIAALREVMRDSRNNDSCDSSHETKVACWRGCANVIRSPSLNFPISGRHQITRMPMSHALF
jgi:hypothetical protein